MNTIKKLVASIFLILLSAGCDPLEKENLEAIVANNVWSNPTVAEAYVNDIYALFMPDFGSYESADTDEGMGIFGGTTISDYLKGTITSDTYNDFPYENIRRINIFIEDIDQATFEESIKQSLKGQAQFWRAWAYFRMVKAYGGVELILTPAPPDNKEALFVPRNKTSECFAQIIKDLDEAIPLLEEKSTVGRIDQCAAMAFKGNVLLYQASPQFNRDNNVSAWTAAYNANKEAIDFLNSMGKGLYPDYKELWHDEMNKEVIMVKRHQYPGYANGYSQACMRPLLYARGCVGANVPSLELVNAYPMKDGSKWDPMVMDYATLFQNRDDRFYASIAYNGAAPFLAEMFGKENMWIYYYDSDGDPLTGINGKEVRTDNSENLYSNSGFYPAKMLDRTITRTTVEDGTVDWIEIRYAEVLMNLAEAANETGLTSEALSILYQIRDRAGIDAGVDGKYGITATSVPEIRQALMDERFVEFAFENKRFSDLRRWRIYSTTMNNLENKTRHGLRFEYNGPVDERPTGLTDYTTVWDKFTVTITEDAMPTSVLEEDKYSFFGIPKSVLERNSKLEQNITWGGSFDPLQ